MRADGGSQTPTVFGRCLLKDAGEFPIENRVCLIGVADPFFSKLGVEPINAAKEDLVHLGACGKRL